MSKEYIIRELRWRNFDARWDNGRIVVRLPAENYKAYITKRKILKYAMQKIGNNLAWDTEFIKAKE